MALQWPIPSAWTDGDHTIHKAVSLPVFSAPIPGVKAKYSFTQDFQCFLAAYVPVAIGTAHPSAGKTPDYSSYVLCEEGPHRDLTGGVIRFTRTYAVPPQSWDDWETYAYNIIGFVNPYYLTLLRARRVENLNCRVRRDYFLEIGSAGNLTVTLQDATSYTLTGGKVVSAGKIAKAYATLYASGPAAAPNIAYITDFLEAYTCPTQAHYLSMVTDAATNSWDATVYAQSISPTGNLTDSNTGGQLTAEDSKLTRWLGPIWCRETRYVLAQ